MFNPDALRALLDSEAPTLDRTMALIAQVDPAFPSVSHTIAELDDIAGDDMLSSPEDLLRHVYGTLGLTGDTKSYYSPENSLLHKVLERRKGNPLSLAVVASEIGRRHNVRLLPVGMPGHVLLTDAQGHWFDPFGGGQPLDQSDCRNLFERFAPNATFSDDVLDPMTLHAVASRTLYNLLNAYGRLGDIGQLIKVTQLQHALSPNPGTLGNLIRLLELVGRFDQAAEMIEKAYDNREQSPRSSGADDEEPGDQNTDAEVAGSLMRLRAHRN